MLSPPPRASRRAVLTGGTVVGAALLATAGCGLRQPEGSAGAAVVDTTAPAVDADTDLVETVAGQLTSALDLAVATGAAVPRLRPVSRRLASLHRAHLRELSRPDDEAGGKVKGSQETAKARLLRAEQKLQRELVQAALDAESGALAQVFASMAAAVAQELAVIG